ncbi:cytochrome C oxidase subunit II [Candidatus Pacearchaeota archaeon CG10_big_fil_rev_8_21_14_0_10_32_14]|nr:MAG: cytochrome C oxidase subunit II [Candidatus Pacearchaeota archaeon CG10_big_fil_rev_8_21_14_0_10_32_14]
MGSSSDTNSNTKVITIDAKKFEFTPNMIKVKKGDNVKIVLNNEDFAHGISIPDFNVKGIDSVEFTADKTGTFQFRCPTICGSGHREMTGNLVVEE